MTNTQPPIQAIIGVSGFRVEAAGVGVSGERIIRIEIPSAFTEEDIARMQKDLAHVALLAQQHPRDMVELGNAAARHDFYTAGRVAERIGLTEAEFAARGGGQVGIAVGIIAVLVVASLIMTDGGSGEGTPPHPQPLPDLDGGLPPGGTPLKTIMTSPCSLRPLTQAQSAHRPSSGRPGERSFHMAGAPGDEDETRVGTIPAFGSHVSGLPGSATAAHFRCSASYTATIAHCRS